MLEYSIHNAGQSRTVFLKGFLKFGDHPIFRGILNELYQGPGQEWLLDLTDLEMIDSAGLALLFIAKKMAEEKDVTMRLLNPRPQAVNLFEAAKISSLFEIEP